MYDRVSGASGDSLSAKRFTSFAKKQNLHKIVESSLVYRQCASSKRVNEVATLNNALDSKKSAVCTRSGGVRGFAPNPDSQVLLQQNLH
ncbi:hypothetical protein [uncultured Helicobacter sp.]|uniref:hypothetical protein n=1 Tax=uncultured Helicobacter sp. TaxID=175537 RepID=UPI00374F2F78